MTVTQMKTDFIYLYNLYHEDIDSLTDIVNGKAYLNLLVSNTSREDCYKQIMQRLYNSGNIPLLDLKAQKIFKRWIKEGLIKGNIEI